MAEHGSGATLPTLHTARLELRPVVPDDLPLLVALNSDPEVMAFLLGRAATTDETRAEWDRRLQRQSDPSRGLGYWAGFEGTEFVGWWSASSFEGRPAIAGLGYRLSRACWGRGLATEGARATVARAFAHPDIERVVASTMAVNTGSRRVLAKVGLEHTSTWVQEWEDPIPGAEQGEVGYELTRDAWQSRRVSPGVAR